MKRYVKDLSWWRRILARFDGGVVSRLRQYIKIRGYRNSRIRALLDPFKKDLHPETWVFVVGCYNSGTKLITDLIACHPNIARMPQEGRFFTDAFPDTQVGGWRRMMARRRDLWPMPEDGATSARVTAKAIQDWSVLWDRKAPVFVEKSICHTTRIPWLARHFGERTPPVFIGIVRNGYCVAESVRRTGEPVGEARQEVGTRYSLALCAEQWRAMNETMLDAFDRTPGCHLFRLEELCLDPLGTLGAIYDTLSLPVPEMHMEDGDVVCIAGAKIKVRRDLNGKRMAMLSAEEIAEMNAVFSDMMVRLDYDLLPDSGVAAKGSP